jgi:hypothetical protein
VHSFHVPDSCTNKESQPPTAFSQVPQEKKNLLLLSLLLSLSLSLSISIYLYLSLSLSLHLYLYLSSLYLSLSLSPLSISPFSIFLLGWAHGPALLPRSCFWSLWRQGSEANNYATQQTSGHCHGKPLRMRQNTIKKTQLKFYLNAIINTILHFTQQ